MCLEEANTATAAWHLSLSWLPGMLLVCVLPTVITLVLLGRTPSTFGPVSVRHAQTAPYLNSRSSTIICHESADLVVLGHSGTNSTPESIPYVVTGVEVSSAGRPFRPPQLPNCAGSLLCFSLRFAPHLERPNCSRLNIITGCSRPDCQHLQVAIV